PRPPLRVRRYVGVEQRCPFPEPLGPAVRVHGDRRRARDLLDALPAPPRDADAAHGGGAGDVDSEPEGRGAEDPIPGEANPRPRRSGGRRTSPARCGAQPGWRALTLDDLGWGLLQER